MSERPLQGMRVLELARILAGPWAGQLLADLGAEVIKVEQPNGGDDTRSWGPPFMPAPEGAAPVAAYFHACNRGKRSVSIDFQSEGGQAQVRELARECDVVIENFKVGGLTKYGLDAKSLQRVNPRLIYCSITGFGQTGPYAARPGYDFIVQALGGIMDLTGEADGPPQKVGVAYADIFTGVYAVVAILAALQGRERSGHGAHIDMALLDTQVAVLANQGMNYLATGVAPARQGNVHPNIAPYQAFATQDGYVIIAVGNDGQFARLCQALGMEAMASAALYATNAARLANRDELARQITFRTKAFSSLDLIALLQACNVPVSAVNTVAQALADPQVLSRGIRRDLDNGRHKTPAILSPIVIDGQRMAAPTPSPNLNAENSVIAGWTPLA